MSRKVKNGGSKPRSKNRSGPSSIPATSARRVKTLQRFLKAYGRGADAKRAREEFAHRVGTTLAYLVHLGFGFRQASPELAIRIERASHGLVSLEDMRPDLDWSYLASRTPQPLVEEAARA